MRLWLASLARKFSRCLARPLAFLRALSAWALALAGQGVAEWAADLGCSAVDPAAEGSRWEGWQPPWRIPGGHQHGSGGGRIETERRRPPWRAPGQKSQGLMAATRLGSWHRGDVGNGRRMARQVGYRPDLVIPDDRRVTAVYMLQGRLEASAAGMVVFLGNDVSRAAGVWVGGSKWRTSGVHGGLPVIESKRDRGRCE